LKEKQLKGYFKKIYGQHRNHRGERKEKNKSSAPI